MFFTLDHGIVCVSLRPNDSAQNRILAGLNEHREVGRRWMLDVRKGRNENDNDGEIKIHVKGYPRIGLGSKFSAWQPFTPLLHARALHTEMRSLLMAL